MAPVTVMARINNSLASPETPTPIEPGLVVLLPKAATRPGHHTQPGDGAHMAQRKITVKAQGPEARATFTMEACQGRV